MTPHAHTKPVGEVGASKQGSLPHGLDRQCFELTPILIRAVST